MKTITELRNAVAEVPELAGQTRRSLEALDAGVRQASSLMTLVAGLALLALALSTVALLRSQAVASRAI